MGAPAGQQDWWSEQQVAAGYGQQPQFRQKPSTLSVQQHVASAGQLCVPSASHCTGAGGGGGMGGSGGVGGGAGPGVGVGSSSTVGYDGTMATPHIPVAPALPIASFR